MNKIAPQEGHNPAENGAEFTNLDASSPPETLPPVFPHGTDPANQEMHEDSDPALTEMINESEVGGVKQTVKWQNAGRGGRKIPENLVDRGFRQKHSRRGKR